MVWTDPAGSSSAELPSGAVGTFAWAPTKGPLIGWQVEGIAAVVDGELVIHELLVKPANLADTAPTGGVTTTVLRSIPLGGLMGALRTAWSEGPAGIASWEATTGESFEAARKQAERAARAVKSTGIKRGRKGYPDDHYRWVALEYLALQREGWSRGILVELAKRATKHLGRDFVARETVRDWVAEARKRQFLTKATQGRAGANPGPNLYSVNEKGTKP